MRVNPVAVFNDIICILKWSTIFFGVCYFGYNLLGWEIYPKGVHEEFLLDVEDVKRNFSGFPVFCFYFIIYLTDRVLSSTTVKFIDVASLFILIGCVLLSLTRGSLILMFAVMLLVLVYRSPMIRSFKRMLFIFALFTIVSPFLVDVFSGHLTALFGRFDEFKVAGYDQSSGYMVRAIEFNNIINNVLDFNPILGFGFTNLNALGLGYQSNVIHGGSPDNGFSNLIGVTGFLGTFLFMCVLVFWLNVNINLQLMKMERFSKVHFIFIIYLVLSFINAASMSYVYLFVVFLVYDLLAYSYYKQMKKSSQSYSKK
ncbi:hypothetical protein GCM10007941_29540 [Amphritea balenae]|nr:hypothetical protein GCM10007941_29540 [Amphritea balenae]